MAALRSDASCLHAWEGSAHCVPTMARLLDDMSDPFCAAIRILYATYERDKYKIASEAGKRHLSTLLYILPNNKIVGDAHQHLWDLQRRGRSVVSSKIYCSRACVNSSVLEERHVQHHTITKEEFVRRWHERPQSVALEFNARKQNVGGLVAHYGA